MLILRSQAAAHPDMHPPNAHSPIGALSVAVPGELAGLALLHSKYGKLPWAACFADAIHLARDGFPVGKDLYEVGGGRGRETCSRLIKTAQAIQATVPGNGHHASTYPDPARPDESWIPTSQLTFLAAAHTDASSLPQVGQLIRRPDLANTLQRIADEGVGVFYEGEIGQSIVDHVRRAGGVVTMQDLKG